MNEDGFAGVELHRRVEERTVIITRIRQMGEGVPGDPIRLATDVWTADGKLLASDDPLQPALMIEARKREREAEAGRQRRLEQLTAVTRALPPSDADIPLADRVARLVAERDAVREHLERYHICGKACRADKAWRP